MDIRVYIIGSLDGGREKVNANGGAEGLGGKVVLEASTDNTAVAVSTGDAAPDAAAVATDLVDVANALANVERSVLLLVHTLDLEKSLGRLLDGTGTLVAEDLTANVKTRDHSFDSFLTTPGLDLTGQCRKKSTA